MKTNWALFILTVLSLLFWWQSALDQQVSAAFYDEANHHFWLNAHPYLESLRHVVMILLVMLNGFFLLVLLLKIIKPNWVTAMKAKTAIYILFCFLLAPGLVVNVILKDHWGRPRPHQVENYGGTAVFQPVWKISRQCDRNCSFVCGDCAMVFSLFAFVPLVRRKLLSFAAVTLAGLFTSFLRVSAGGHFISDALLSGLIVYLVISGIYGILYGSSVFDEQRIEMLFNDWHKYLMRFCT